MRCSMKSALVHGTFDPPTNGHLWLVATSLKMFDRIMVAVAPPVNRHPMFTAGERVELWWQSLCGLGEGQVEIIPVGGESEAAIARQHGCDCLLFGVRDATEEIERAVWGRVLHDLDPGVRPEYLRPPPDVAAISSSRVREMVGRDGWVETVKPLITVPVWEALVRRKNRTVRGGRITTR
jgi:pantetheine-phosphate adenylyltransferase